MMKKKICFVLLLGILLVGKPIFCFAESWNFSKKNISEIIFSVSAYSGISITTDETVSGVADFYFSGDDFEKAFDSFLKANRLYVEKKDDIWTVSRVQIVKKDDLYSLDAVDIDVFTIFEKLRNSIGCTVTIDNSENQKISIHTGFLSSSELIKVVVRQMHDYNVAEQNGVFHVSKNIKIQGKNTSAFIVKNQDELFDADIKNAVFGDVLEALFQAACVPFCLLGNSGEKIERVSVENQSFDSLLNLICAYGNCMPVLIEEVWYVIPSKDTKLSLSQSGKSWELFETQFIDSSKITSLLKARFLNPEVILLPDSKKFFVLIENEKIDEFRTFVNLVDCPQKSQIVNLKYINFTDFMAHLPPSVKKDEIVPTGSGNNFFFTGSESSFQKLLQEMPLTDKPAQSIRYDLLIMQYENSESSTWSASLGAKRLELGDMNGLSAQLGNVMSFNLDVISAFGLKFAAQLQASIQENKAHVFANTVLRGVSGTTINFQNTNTYRYRDNNLDPETGKPVYSGVTREIISGLKLDVLGWVSGDGIITSKVTASVSHQGTDVSSSTGNPPPTSEKIITTEVRTNSGEPVILSGLLQESENKTVERTPFLSKIPILGMLFKGEQKTKESSDMVIYLVPHLENDNSTLIKNNKSFAMNSKNILDKNNSESDYELMTALFEKVILFQEKK